MIKDIKPLFLKSGNNKNGWVALFLSVLVTDNELQIIVGSMVKFTCCNGIHFCAVATVIVYKTHFTVIT